MKDSSIVVAVVTSVTACPLAGLPIEGWPGGLDGASAAFGWEEKLKGGLSTAGLDSPRRAERRGWTDTFAICALGSGCENGLRT